MQTGVTMRASVADRPAIADLVSPQFTSALILAEQIAGAVVAPREASGDHAARAATVQVEAATIDRLRAGVVMVGHTGADH